MPDDNPFPFIHHLTMPQFIMLFCISRGSFCWSCLGSSSFTTNAIFSTLFIFSHRFVPTRIRQDILYIDFKITKLSSEATDHKESPELSEVYTLLSLVGFRVLPVAMHPLRDYLANLSPGGAA